MEEIRLPGLVDEPTHFLLWQWDDALPACLGLIAGIWLGSPLAGLLGGALLSKQYKRIRDSKPKGFFFHWLRKLGLINTGTRYKSMPPALTKKYIS